MLEGLNFSQISSFWKRFVFFVCVDFRFCFVTTAVTLHWANKRVHYSKGLGVLAEVLAIWVFIDSPSLSLASEKFLIGSWQSFSLKNAFTPGMVKRYGTSSRKERTRRETTHMQ